MSTSESNFDPYSFLILNDSDPYKVLGRDLCQHTESYLGVEKCNLTVVPLGCISGPRENNTNPAFETRIIHEKKSFFKNIDHYLDVIVCHSYDQPHFRKGVLFWLDEEQSFIVYNSSDSITEFVDYSGKDWKEGISLNEWLAL